ncbi:MAG: TRAP transporter small permease [Pseudoxanthomonas sp.]
MTETPNNPSVPPLQAAMDQLARFVIGLAAVALLGLVVVQGWQVIARYVLNDSPSWTEPVTVLLLSTTMSLGAAAGVHERRHFSFSLLADSLSPGLRRALRGVAQLVVVLIGATIAWWATVLFFDGLGIRAAGAQMPQSASYLPMAIGGTLMTLFAAVGLPRELRGDGEKR